MKLRVSRGSFSLTELPREALRLLLGFDGVIVVEVGNGYYYFYFRREDVEKALRLIGG